MSEAFIGQIVMFAGNFAPRNWAFCSGQLLSISQNTALFSILGTTYGGNGQTTFALPDLRGRVPMHPGTGPGLTPRTLGESSGTENVTLVVTEIPGHTHTFTASIPANTSDGTSTSPGGNVLANVPAQRGISPINVYTSSAANSTLAPFTGNTNPTGGSQPHNNLQPYLCVNFIICMFGIFPSRN